MAKTPQPHKGYFRVKGFPRTMAVQSIAATREPVDIGPLDGFSSVYRPAEDPNNTIMMDVWLPGCARPAALISDKERLLEIQWNRFRYARLMGVIHGIETRDTTRNGSMLRLTICGTSVLSNFYGRRNPRDME